MTALALDKRSSFALCLLCVALPGLLSGCNNENASQATPRHAFEPRSISALRSQNIGTVFATVTVNDQLISERLAIADNETRVNLDATLFSSDLNSLSVRFWLTPADVAYQSTPQLLAEADMLVPYTMPGETVNLPPIQYRYADSDSDSIADVLEWQIQPVDIDNDLLANSEDADSDGDGLNDNIDTTPYGNAYPIQNADAFVLMPIALPDNDASRLPLAIGSQTSSEVRYIQDSLSQVSLGTTGNWPFTLGTLPPPDQSQVYPWQVIDVESYVRSNCPDWRIALDASSLEANTSGSALLYFRRFDSEPILLPLGSGKVDNLATIAPQALQISGQASVQINDGLRLVFVSTWTTGWLTVWSEAELTGRSCSINLSATNI